MGTGIFDIDGNMPTQKFRKGDIIKVRGDNLVAKIEDVGWQPSAECYVYSVRPRQGPLISFVKEGQLSWASFLERKWYQASS